MSCAAIRSLALTAAIPIRKWLFVLMKLKPHYLSIFSGVGATVEHSGIRIDQNCLITSHAAAALPLDVVSKAT